MKFGFLVLLLAGCGLNSNVTFKDGYNGNNVATAPAAPGLGVSAGGFFKQTTTQGNTASLTLGAPVAAVSGTTPQNNTYHLNVSGALKP